MANAKISIQQDEGTVTLKLEGSLTELYSAEVKRAWNELAPTLDAKKLSIDVRGVTYMDAKGQDILRGIYQQTGAEFIANTPLTKYFADQAQITYSSNGKGVPQ